MAEHGPSEKAVERAIENALGRAALLAQGSLDLEPPELPSSQGAEIVAITTGALSAAHDPALGLDRSVCLRDVVAFLERKGQLITGSVYGAAGEVERAFIESSSPDREG